MNDKAKIDAPPDEATERKLFMERFPTATWDESEQAFDLPKYNTAFAGWKARAALPRTSAEPTVMRALQEACNLAMKNTVAARIPECGDFGAIAQGLSWVIQQMRDAAPAAPVSSIKPDQEAALQALADQAQELSMGYGAAPVVSHEQLDKCRLRICCRADAHADGCNTYDPARYPDKWAAPAAPVADTGAVLACHCEACEPNTWDNQRMILCSTCGNKRCPHATDHRNACTNSNDPGQPGSSYANCAPATPTASADSAADARGWNPTDKELVSMIEDRRDAALWRECLELAHGMSDQHGEWTMVQLPRPEGVFKSSADEFIAAIEAASASIQPERK